MPGGLIAEYADPRALVRAVHALRERHYARLEAYTPHPVPDLDLALGRGRSKIGLVIFAAAIAAAIGAYGLEWLIDAYLYPVNVGGRPAHMPLAYVPITFEACMLAAGVTAFVAVLVRARLVRLWRPVFEVDGFASATSDGYWLAVAGNDARFDRERTAGDLRATGALKVVFLMALAACSTERMNHQPRCGRDEATTLLPGGACDLTPPEGAVAFGAELPLPPLSRALLERGRDRFDRFCAACHGLAGDGQSPVADAMALRRPPSLVALHLPDDRVDDVIAHGYGLMPSYADALGAADREAVVAYLRVLADSQDTALDALSPELRTEAARWLR